jgi:hypothetical protein
VPDTCSGVIAQLTEGKRMVHRGGYYIYVYIGDIGLADHRGVEFCVNIALSSILQQFLSTVSNGQVGFSIS